MSKKIFIIMVCFFLYFGESAAVRIGAIVDLRSQIGQEQKVSIEIAAKDFESYVSDGLFINTSDSSSQAENLINKWKADAIVIAKPWPEIVQTTKLATKAGVPVLSLSSAHPLTLFPKPYLFQLSPSASAYIQCLADIIMLYNWRQVIVFGEDDDYSSTSSSIIPHLSNSLQAIGSDIVLHVELPHLESLPNPKVVIRQELKRLSKQLVKVYIIVSWSSPLQAINLFKEANALGMMTEGHVWIVGDDITTLLGSTFSPSFVESYMQGFIGIKTYFNDANEAYQNFSTKFRQRINAEPTMHAIQAYDAIQVVARAYGNDGGKFIQGISSTNFIGLSGKVQFKNNANSMSFHLINIVGKSFREMGRWNKGIGFFEPKIDKVGMVWPGGSTGKVPGGWGKLRIGVPESAVVDKFVKVEKDESGRVKEVTGFCIDVFMKARQRLNYTLDYDFHPYSGTSYNDLVASIPETFDGVVGDVTAFSTRFNHTSFTEPFMPSGLTMLVRVKPESTRWVLTRPFSNQVWFIIVASYIYTCIVVWYLEQKDNPDFQGRWHTQLGATLWLIFSTIFFAHGKLHSYYTKIVVGAWVFVLLILTSAFTACLGSILTTQKVTPVYSDRKIGCDNNSFVLNYLQDVLHYKYETIERMRSIDEYDSAFKSGKITEAYVETPYLRVFLAKYDGYATHGDTKRLGGFAFVFPKGSPLTDDFSRAILQLAENGTLNVLEEKWFSLSIGSCPIVATDRTEESLGLDSLWALFLITGSVSTAILVLFKARFLPNYSIRSIRNASLPARDGCVNIWKYKFKSRRRNQISRRHPSLSHQVAPDIAEENSPNYVQEVGETVVSDGNAL